MSSPHPALARKLVLETMARLGASPAEVADMSETLLVQEGQFYGRTYRAGDLLAMWLAGTTFAQFYSADGQLVEAVDLAEVRQVHRQAA
jgi:hypothetical protein